MSNKKSNLHKFLKILAIIVVFILCAIKINAQDIHFSQYKYSPLSLNPANTGNFDGNWRFSNNYRKQWSNVGIPYQTVSVGFDKAFKIKSNFLGLGVLFVNDRSGSAFLNINKIGLSSSYFIKIANGHYLGIGLSGAYALQAYDFNELSFPSQFNTNTGLFDNTLPNNISQRDENISYVDLNTGVQYRTNQGNKKPYGGIALFHLNMPKVSFLQEDNRLNMRIAGNAGINMMLSENMYIDPHILFMYQKAASDYVIGAEAGYLFHSLSFIDKLFAGVAFRTALTNYDALIVSGGAELYNFVIGVSYDVNVSRLATVSNMRGAFEISLIYKNITKTIDQISLPCDRY
ncbi:MAG: PorP/SprF family type IX secretion system membrane protein [Bacteroidales bacterium]|nr:PorP/SprF family type IX secretion system membrane protein [Bacteroidales bacterium]